MRVPARTIRERDLESDIRFDELRDLEQRAPQAALRVVDTCRRPVLAGVGPFQHLDRVETFAGGGREQAGSFAFIQLFKRACELVARALLRNPPPEGLETVDRQPARAARQNARQLRPES